MISWEELLKNRVEIKSVRNSAHLLECRKIVLAKYPEAKIVGTGKQWQLVDGETKLSNPHDGHYDCWLETRTLMEKQ